MRLALLGKPGAGKSTQSAVLARRLGVPVISTGALLRLRAAVTDEDARRLAAVLARGELVDDDFVVSVVKDAIAALDEEGYLLDGFPRTLAQAQRTDAPPLDAVILLDLPDDVARQRLAHRADGGRTDDDSRAVAERRLHLFNSETGPVLNLYGRRGILRAVDATQSPEAVTEAVLRSLGDVSPSPG
ncbi:MAG TPA: nucleoside monophosphate kinase [Acidimicrobiales bacterium]|nr:nucleoside monophosphate kinase [Acidimicrobiales bacterium]